MKFLNLTIRDGKKNYGKKIVLSANFFYHLSYLGGVQDLYPRRNQPGDFRGIGILGQAGPDLIPGRSFRAPMGARYDPMGPIPDDDFRPGRQNMHPDLMRRPGFGSYFDGGGFI